MKLTFTTGRRFATVLAGILVLACAPGASGADEDLREFTDVKGRKLNAEFLGLQGEGDQVNLRLSTGKIVIVALDRLSAADQAFIKKHPLGKLKPVKLPAVPLHPVKEWSAKAKRDVVYFINQDGKNPFRRKLTYIHKDGFAECLGEYAIVRGPQLGVLDTAGSAAIGVSSVGPDGLEAGSDAPIFIAQSGKGADAVYTYLNKSGKPFIKRKFAAARPFNSERAWVNLDKGDLPKGGTNGLWTLIDYTGNLLHAFEDLAVQDFSEGRAGVALDIKGRQWSIIDVDAKVIAEGPFSKVWPFLDGAAVVDGRLMGLDGKWIMPEDSEWYIENRHALSENDAVVARRKRRQDGKTRYSILKRSTGEFLADIPDELYVGEGFSNGLAMASDNKAGKSGYINRLGVVVIEVQFARAKPFRNGFAEVGIKNIHDHGVINLTGEVIWKPERMPEIEPAKPEAGKDAPKEPEN